MRPIRHVLAVLLLAIAPMTAAPALAERDTMRPAQWATPVDLPEASNFYRVTPDFYRAAQPDRAAMKAFEDYGIKTVINLRGFHSDADEVKGTDLTLVEIPLNAWSVSENRHVIRMLQAIRDAEKPVLVHCHHGADRTGLAIAMFRMVEQGWSREAALDEMRNGGYGFHEIWENIPEYLERVDVDAVRSALK